MRFAHASQVRGSCEAGTMSNGVAPCSQRVEGRGERVEGRGTSTGLCLSKFGASLAAWHQSVACARRARAGRRRTAQRVFDAMPRSRR